MTGTVAQKSYTTLYVTKKFFLLNENVFDGNPFNFKELYTYI